MSALTSKQAIAVQLYRQHRTVEQIQTNTGLDRAQIVAAVDRAATEYYRHPNTPPPPCRKRTGRTPS